MEDRREERDVARTTAGRPGGTVSLDDLHGRSGADVLYL